MFYGSWRIAYVNFEIIISTGSFDGSHFGSSAGRTMRSSLKMNNDRFKKSFVCHKKSADNCFRKQKLRVQHTKQREFFCGQNLKSMFAKRVLQSNVHCWQRKTGAVSNDRMCSFSEDKFPSETRGRPEKKIQQRNYEFPEWWRYVAWRLWLPL